MYGNIINDIKNIKSHWVNIVFLNNHEKFDLNFNAPQNSQSINFPTLPLKKEEEPKLCALFIVDFNLCDKISNKCPFY